MLSITNHQENANQNHNEILLHTHQDDYYVKTENNKFLLGCKGTGILVHCWWECKMQLPWKTVWVFLKNLNIELLYDPEVPLLGVSPKVIESRDLHDTWTSIFTAAFLTVVKNRSISFLSLVGRANKMQNIHTIECFSAFKKKKILTHAIIWNNLEAIMDFPGDSAVKNLPAMQKMWVRSLRCEDAPEKEMSTQSYLCLGNPTDRGAWWATVHGVAKSDTTQQLNNNRGHQAK